MKGPEKLLLDERDISPLVLTSYLFSQWSSYAGGEPLRARWIFDYECELVTESEGVMVLDGKRYELSRGDLVFRKPGQYTQAFMRFNCYAIFFDMTGKNGKTPGFYDMHADQPFQPLYLNPVLDSIPTLTKTGLTDDWLEIFQSILNHHVNPGPGSVVESRSLLLKLISRLHQDATNGLNTAGRLSGPHYHLLKRVLAYMEQNRSKRLSLEELAQVSGLSPNYFHAIFRETLGVTPNAWLTDMKVKHAKELLAGSTHSISDIAETCGFQNIPYFTVLFGKVTGMSPSEFRKRHSPKF